MGTYTRDRNVGLGHSRDLIQYQLLLLDLSTDPQVRGRLRSRERAVKVALLQFGVGHIMIFQLIPKPPLSFSRRGICLPVRSDIFESSVAGCKEGEVPGGLGGKGLGKTCHQRVVSWK